MNAMQPSVRLRGFTMVEILIALSLSVLILAGAMRLLVTVLQRDALSAEHVRVISEGQKMADFLRTTTRLTSLQEMVLFPEIGPHNAVSYPLPPADMPVQNQAVGPDGFVDWGETTVLHAWPPDDVREIRLTRFRPRDNSLTDAERLEQLAHVSLTGGGQGTHNGTNASTLVLARVQADFSVRTAMSGYNFYAAAETLDANVSLGGIRVRPRENSLKFRVTGRSSPSSGFRLMMDRFFLSPSGLSIEAEALLPPAGQSGATAGIAERLAANWSGERALLFPATSVGSQIELTYFNDTWHEVRFNWRGAEFENSFAETRTEPGQMGFWLRPAGRQLAWFAPFQTGGTGEKSSLEVSLAGAAVRTVLRGRLAGDHITATGDGVRLTFGASGEAGRGMRILRAYISEAASHTNPNHQISSNPDLTRQVRFGDPQASQSSVWIPTGGQAVSVPVDFPMDPDKSYVVSYLLGSDFENGNSPGYPAWYQDANREDTYILPGTVLPGNSMTQALRSLIETPSWSGEQGLEERSGVVGIAEVNTTFFNEAVYTSRIVDTTLSAPSLEMFRHDSEVPNGTSLQFYVRSGEQPDLSDALDWNFASLLPLAGGAMNMNEKRYLQVQVRMERDRIQDRVPRVRSFTLNWPGPERSIDFGGSFIRTPQGGIAEILVNDVPPATSFRADIQLTSEQIHRSPVPGARDWRINVETTPRNR